MSCLEPPVTFPSPLRLLNLLSWPRASLLPYSFRCSQHTNTDDSTATNERLIALASLRCCVQNITSAFASNSSNPLFVKLGIQKLTVVDPEADAKAAAEAAAKNQVTLCCSVTSRASVSFCPRWRRNSLAVCSVFVAIISLISWHVLSCCFYFDMLFLGAADHRCERRCCRCAHHGVHLLQAGKGSYSQVSDDE